MCGISAFVSKKGESASVIRRATEIIKHRGPDDEGYLLVDMTNAITLADETRLHMFGTLLHAIAQQKIFQTVWEFINLVWGIEGCQYWIFQLLDIFRCVIQQNVIGLLTMVKFIITSS